MSVEHPENLDEWREHIASITAEQLWSKAVSANRTGFVTALRGEGYDMASIEQIFVFLAERFVSLNEVPPRGGYFDLVALGDRARESAPG